MLVHFSKMECLGQDFMVMDAVTEKIFPVAEKIQKWAQRCTGVGFSEFALVEPPYDPDTDFYFRVFSDTGQERQLSGHASLAMGRFVRDRRLINRPSIRAGYNGGIIALDVADENVISVNMGRPVYDPIRLGFKTKKQEKTYILENGKSGILVSVVGLPEVHVVVESREITSADITGIGKSLSASERFTEVPAIDFMEIVNNHELVFRGYRHNKGECASSGTGGVASALVGVMHKTLESPVKINCSSGTEEVVITADGSVSLSAQVNFVFSGMVEI
ncbi:diaminopimelate epimerase [Succinimonas amylolytica]|uniref:diaminopimelate epimerase n=1 Tax=Succinimonas amylolytica TaxID=83769 RepID=UPI000375BF71|nr:diaminopimelate epimerase [Succinimonas amylolytica]